MLFIVAKPILNYCFHNPNTIETTAGYILKVFMEVNEKKVEAAVQNDLKDREVCYEDSSILPCFHR